MKSKKFKFGDKITDIDTGEKCIFWKYFYMNCNCGEKHLDGCAILYLDNDEKEYPDAEVRTCFFGVKEFNKIRRGWKK